MIDQIKHWYDESGSEQKTKIKRAATLGVIVLVITVVYSMRDDGSELVVAEPEISEITLGTDLLEDDVRTDVKKQLQDFDTERNDDKARISNLESQLTDLIKQRAEQAASAKEDEKPLIEGVASFPSPPPLRYNGQSHAIDQSLQEAEKRVGGIGRKQGVKAEDMPEKKPTRSVKLAPGFMEGMLLTGVEALSSEGAQGDPEPILVRVQAPTVLPNEVRANLVGCFVVANAFGVLAKEKVEARLVSLTCMNAGGQVVIDEEIKGYLADKSGKKGIAAIVSAKQGTHLARAVVAGIFGGVGEAISLESTTQSTSPLGTTQVIDSDKVYDAGIGQGIKSGAEKIQEVFLELAKNTAPTLEVGAAAKVTVVLTQTVNLKIG